MVLDIWFSLIDLTNQEQEDVTLISSFDGMPDHDRDDPFQCQCLASVSCLYLRSGLFSSLDSIAVYRDQASGRNWDSQDDRGPSGLRDHTDIHQTW